MSEHTNANGDRAHKRKRSQSESPDPEPGSKLINGASIVVKDKKQKACLNCRRSKLKCVVGADGGACVRCATRKEECRFKTRAHDDEWQEATSNRIDGLSRAVEQLSQSMNLVMRHLNLPASGSRPVTNQLSNSTATPTTNGVQPAPSPYPSPWLSPPPTNNAPLDPHPQPPSSMAYSLDHNNVDGAEALLAQTETSDDYYPLSHHTPTGSNSGGAPGTSGVNGAQGHTPPGGGTGLYSLLDDLINTAPVNATASAASKLAEGLGESDPRSDIIKTGVVNLSDANVLVDHFHAHLAHHLFGFPLQIGSWPYLPEGKPTMTPLILGVACLIPAERLPHYHRLFEILMGELQEGIFNAKPGYSNTSPMNAMGGQSHRGVADRQTPTTTDPDAEAATLDAPDLDLELGIGPEEITALCAAATFTCSDKSDAMARTVFEWTRGYLKTFKNPPPHPLTLGEVCGLLPPRRNLTFENWLRLWLFAYIVYAQQALHRNRRAAVFDPRPFCSLLFDNLQSISQSEQSRDLQLIGHARLCAIFQRVQHAMGASSWRYGTVEGVITAFDAWNAEVSTWKAEIDRFELPGHAKMLLTSFGLFARVYINQGGLEDPVLVDNPRRWVYGTAAAQAAHDMLEIAQLEPFCSGLATFPPIYIQMVTLSAAVLLKSLRHSVHIVMPTFHARICDMVERIADILKSDNVPVTHVSRSASIALRQAVSRVKTMPSS